MPCGICIRALQCVVRCSESQRLPAGALRHLVIFEFHVFPQIFTHLFHIFPNRPVAVSKVVE